MKQKPNLGGVIEKAELERQKIVKSEKYLLNEENDKYHRDACYISRPLGRLIEEADSLNKPSELPEPPEPPEENVESNNNRNVNNDGYVSGDSTIINLTTNKADDKRNSDDFGDNANDDGVSIKRQNKKFSKLQLAKGNNYTKWIPFNLD
ncbi:23642_t:CDS:2 [Entrophospora sp. SA101]|nr:23642_t:CDS:2 [Entrophospora sp. SA101]